MNSPEPSMSMGNGRRKTSNDLTEADLDARIPDADDSEMILRLGFKKDLHQGNTIQPQSPQSRRCVRWSVTSPISPTRM